MELFSSWLWLSIQHNICAILQFAVRPLCKSAKTCPQAGVVTLTWRVWPGIELRCWGPTYAFCCVSLFSEGKHSGGLLLSISPRRRTSIWPPVGFQLVSFVFSGTQWAGVHFSPGKSKEQVALKSLFEDCQGGLASASVMPWKARWHRKKDEPHISSGQGMSPK